MSLAFNASTGLAFTASNLLARGKIVQPLIIIAIYDESLYTTDPDLYDADYARLQTLRTRAVDAGDKIRYALLMPQSNISFLIPGGRSFSGDLITSLPSQSPRVLEADLVAAFNSCKNRVPSVEPKYLKYLLDTSTNLATESLAARNAANATFLIDYPDLDIEAIEDPSELFVQEIADLFEEHL